MSITPLGSPVLPLEKMTVARSSMVRRAGFAPMALREKSLRQCQCEQEREELFSEPGDCSSVFEQDGAAGNFELREALDKGLGSDDHIDFALLRAGGDDFAGRGVVEVDGNAAEHGERVVGEGSANRRREQQADHGLVADGWAQAARDEDRLW